MVGETLTQEQEAARSQKYEELHRRFAAIKPGLDLSRNTELDGLLWDIAREIVTA